METVEDTRHPLGPGRDGGVVLGGSEPRIASNPSTPIAKLVECDQHLSSIGAEVATLREELARLREEADERGELLAERDIVIAELGGLLPTLEEARVQARRQAQDASAALAGAEARVSEQKTQVIELRRELEAIDATKAEHDRIVAELEAGLAGARAKLEETERARAEAHARAQSAEPALAEARERVEDLSADRDRLLLERDDERARARQQAEETSAALGAAEARLARQTTRVETLERELDTIGAALAQRVGRLAQLEAELVQAGVELAPQKTEAVEVPYPSEEPRGSSHLRFVLRAGGYTVSDCDGAPPKPGEIIEIDGERFAVAKIGRSPFPGDRRPCAYLLGEPGRELSGR